MHGTFALISLIGATGSSLIHSLSQFDMGHTKEGVILLAATAIGGIAATWLESKIRKNQTRHKNPKKALA
jgi:uncharacterized membrane protein YfcA